jgi:hypothetical protein
MLQFNSETSAAAPPAKTRQKRKAFWLRQLHTWHWVSAAVCLIGMLLFSFTGITLNNASLIEASPVRTTTENVLPASVLAAMPGGAEAEGPLPSTVSGWIDDQMGVAAGGIAAEWSDGEAYVALPRPGGDAWLSIDTQTGDVTYERTDRGWIAYLNDLHKGRNTGTAWSWFIDLFAVACVVFSITGLFLLQLHAPRRPATWPVVGAGFVIPLLLALVFIH